MTAGKPILLRLLSGLQAGAAMELAPGEWVMGSGDASDLVVMDPGVRERHLALRVAEDGTALLVPLEGEVRAASGPVSREGMALDHFVVFSAGMLSACIGPADEPWPEVRPPAPPPAAETAQADGPASTPEALPPTPEPGNNVGAANKSSRGRSWRVIRILAFLAAVAALCVGIYPQRKADTDELTQMLRDAGFPEVFAESADGGVRIQGLVPGDAALDSLGIYVSGVAPEAVVDVLSVEAVARALQGRVLRADAALRVSRAGGTLRITGYVFDMASLERLFAEEQEMLRHVPAKVDVITWKELAPALTRLIRSRDLKSRLRVIPGAYRIAVQTQTLTPRQEEDLTALLLEAEAFVGDTQPFVREEWEQPTHVAPPPAGSPPAPGGTGGLAAPSAPKSGTKENARPGGEGSPSPFSLLFSSQSTGAFQCGRLGLAGSGPGMAVLFDGVRYRVGSKLPNGYQIRAITPEYVVFQIGRQYTQICTPKDMNRETKP